MKKERFEAITDAVMAIILTLMVLEIKLPEISFENLSTIFQQISVYAISFTMIAILWLNHHHIFAEAEGRIPINMVWLNFALMFATSFIPMATEKLAEHFHQPENHVFFSLVLAIVCLFYSILQREAAKMVSYKNYRQIQLLNWGSVVVYLAAAPLSFISVYLAGGIYILFISMFFIVSKKSMQ